MAAVAILHAETPVDDVVALRSHLSAAGVAVIPEGDPARPDAIIVPFNDPDDRILAVIERAVDAAPTIAISMRAMAPHRSWQLLAAGVADVIAGLDAPAAAEAIRSRVERIEGVECLLRRPDIARELVGASPPWLRVLRLIAEVAHFSSAGVLLRGESGTGKEMMARLIHALDRRAPKGPLVTLDCGTVSAELAGSELFGHVRGAYTGAIAEREGALAIADHGTLFLDELGELPLAVQAQLLRAIEEGVFKPVGSIKWRRSQFRLVCATNRDLNADVAAGRFRLDLYHRVLAWTVELPPLRDRTEDIVPLARHFMAQGRAAPVPGLDSDVEAFLRTRAYPGNIRELRQLVLRIMTRHAGPGPVTVGDIPPMDRADSRPPMWPDAQFESAIRRGLDSGRGLKEIGREAEAAAMRLALRDAGGNSRGAAERLGITERAVQMRRAVGESPR